MSVPKLIGITGKAGSGKDTLADALVLEYGAVKYNFALPLKQALNAMFGWTMDQWNDREWKEGIIPWLGKSPRMLAQTLGTEWGRELVHPELWVLLAEQRYKAHVAQGPDRVPFVIPDVRFDNEAIMIRQLGGVVIEAVRPQAQAIAAHKSENGLKAGLVDLHLMNNRSVQDYLERAFRFLELTA